MKQVWIRCFGWLMAVIVMPAMAMAQEVEREMVDARLEGYDTNVTIPPGGVGLVWLLLIFLAAICLGVMFKDARRTHLD